ncbi:MAG: Uma2 family endonuclease [Phycisphaerae bacterium]|nr:Uma2 family endonuclease [Saprospiraceae bacterium]
MTARAANGKSKYVSWPEFQKHYLHREDGYKYEWLNGEVAKFKGVDYTQFYIACNLWNLFEQLLAIGQASGILMSGGDIFFGQNHRRPDLAYLTDEQIARTAYGENQVPQFVIEVISSNDQLNAVADKMGNYRSAGVQVVWLILPNRREVQVFSGEKLNRMAVCSEDDLCSAAPALPAFEMTANEIFRKPPKPE